jgi:hypothetical protein
VIRNVDRRFHAAIISHITILVNMANHNCNYCSASPLSAERRDHKPQRGLHHSIAYRGHAAAWAAFRVCGWPRRTGAAMPAVGHGRRRPRRLQHADKGCAEADVFFGPQFVPRLHGSRRSWTPSTAESQDCHSLTLKQAGSRHRLISLEPHRRGPLPYSRIPPCVYKPLSVNVPQAPAFLVPLY